MLVKAKKLGRRKILKCNHFLNKVLNANKQRKMGTNFKINKFIINNIITIIN